MNALKRARLLSGKRQFDVFRLVGIWPGRLSLIENGLISPRPEEVEALCQLYGIGPADAKLSEILQDRPSD
jgi:transcriptional regulator with XRE-family HTH domain